MEKKNKSTGQTNEEIKIRVLSLRETLKQKGLPLILITFFAYCALEQTAMLWASSYLVKFRDIAAETAAMFASLFFLGITFGRFLCGFIADKAGDKRLIRAGIFIIMCGVVLIGIPVKNNIFPLAGLIIVGFGCAPVYPSIIHATPFNFGKENSQSVIGVQMASAYVGTTFMPPLFGLIAQYIHIGLFPAYLLILSLLMLLMSEFLNKTISKKHA